MNLNTARNKWEETANKSKKENVPLLRHVLNLYIPFKTNHTKFTSIELNNIFRQPNLMKPFLIVLSELMDI